MPEEVVTERVEDIVKWLRDTRNYRNVQRAAWCHTLADRIERAAKRVYNTIDSEVCAIEGISSFEVGEVRIAMKATIGDYYE